MEPVSAHRTPSIGRGDLDGAGQSVQRSGVRVRHELPRTRRAGEEAHSVAAVAVVEAANVDVLVSPRESSGQVDIGERVAMRWSREGDFQHPVCEGLGGQGHRSARRLDVRALVVSSAHDHRRLRCARGAILDLRQAPQQLCDAGIGGLQDETQDRCQRERVTARGERGDEHLRGDLLDDGPRVRLGDHVFQRRPWMESRSCHGSSPASSMGGTGSRGDRVRRRSGSVPIGEAKSAARRDQRWWSLLRKHAASDLPLVRPVCCAKAAQHHPRCAAPTMR